MALVFAIGLLALLLMIGMAFIGNAVNYRRVAENNSARSQSRMFAFSAVARMVSSLTVFTHQHTKEDPNQKPPKNLDHIYSFAEYKNNGAVEKGGSKLTDALLGEKSLLLLPDNYSVIDKEDALSFNARFENKTWEGSWVFFTNGKTGSDRRIIGRAAWQVIGSSADIVAPVFMRGHLAPDDDNTVAHSPDKLRWGREIDEVYLGNIPLFSNVAGIVQDRDSDWINSYDKLYQTVGASSDAKLQRWVETWFLPESENQPVGKATPMPDKKEIYIDDGYAVPRFNISELVNGVDWESYYDGIDQWYARFWITAASDANSDTAISKLTQSAEDDPRVKNKKYDYDGLVFDDNTSALPFLRRIGNAPGTFENKTALRKQIAANFNDYCDSDGMPTSDVPAKDWLKDMDSTTYVHPTYTGNEKTPYIYELGMNFGIVPGDSSKKTIEATKPESAADGTYRMDAVVKAAPIVKLCNMYPLDIVASNGVDKDLYSDFGADASDFMRSYVNFGNISFKIVIREAVLKNMVFSYVTETQKYVEKDDGNGNKSWEPDGQPVVETKKFKLDKLTVNDSFIDNSNMAGLKQVFSFTGNKWERAGVAAAVGAKTILPVVFARSDVDNFTNHTPYPVKVSSGKDDQQWQTAACQADSAGNSPLEFSLTPAVADFFTASGSGNTATADEKSGITINTAGITASGDGAVLGTLDEFKYAVGSRVAGVPSDGEVVTYKDAAIGVPESVDIDKVKLSDLSTGGIRRAVLTANIPVGTSAAEESGVDYVKELAASLTTGFNDLSDDDRTITVNSGADGTAPVGGFVIGSYRNYDPRQNLNGGDWSAVPAVKKIADFINPDKSVVAQVMRIDSTGGAGLVNAADLDTEKIFSPKCDAGNTQDWELAAEPAYLDVAKNQHVSTAVIRNAPMMSPWEIGFIHRGVRWQTINLKASNTGGGDYLGMHEPKDNWEEAGTSYGSGDGAILEQIKMTDRIPSYGKLNVARLRTDDRNFNDHAEENKAIIKAIFQNIEYGTEPWDFIEDSRRNSSSGKFPAPRQESEKTRITSDDADAIVTKFLEVNTNGSNRRIELLNVHKDGLGLENAYSDKVADTQQTDAAFEEIIGKTMNLFSAEPQSLNRVNVVVVAQSIRDMAGEQVQLTDETVDGKLTSPNGGTKGTIEDGTVTMECEYGKFDMLQHADDSDKNVYFDQITGEVKMFVRLFYDNSTGRMTVQKIDYL